MDHKEVKDHKDIKVSQDQVEREAQQVGLEVLEPQGIEVHRDTKG